MLMNPSRSAWPVRAAMLAAVIYGVIEWLALMRSRVLDRFGTRSKRAG